MPFQNIQHLNGLLSRANAEYPETLQLLNYFDNQKLVRNPFYVTLDEFDSILRWKLKRQYGRQAGIRELLTDHNIRLVTSTVSQFHHTNTLYEDRSKIELLCVLPGVMAPVASAYLALVYPDQYAVIDFRNWRVIYNEEKRSFRSTDYVDYMLYIRALAEHWGKTAQEIDLALWQLDKETNG